MKNDIVATDICNTLYNSNTTFDFFKYLYKKGHLKGMQRVIYTMTISRKSIVFWGLAVLQKLVKKDFHKQIIIRLLKNKEVATVNHWAADFYTNFLIPNKINSTLAIIEQEKNEEIILVSATIAPVAEAIANKLGVKYIATNLEIVNNKYTGKMLQDLTGNKLQALKEIYGTELSLKLAMSDNTTDYDLLKSASRKIAVCYSDKQKAFWSTINNIEIIRL